MATIGDDPGLQSFLRTLTSRRSQVEAERNRRLAALMARRGIEMAEIGVEEQQQGEQVDDDFEGRGLFRSGGRLEDRADVVQNANTLRARTDFNLAEESASANREAAMQLSGLSSQRAQAEMDARQRIADREFALASQARAERLAAEERSRWEAEQKRLQALYDREAARSRSSSGGFSLSAPRSFTTAPTRRVPSRINPSPGSGTARGRAYSSALARSRGSTSTRRPTRRATTTQRYTGPR